MPLFWGSSLCIEVFGISLTGIDWLGPVTGGVGSKEGSQGVPGEEKQESESICKGYCL